MALWFRHLRRKRKQVLPNLSVPLLEDPSVLDEHRLQLAEERFLLRSNDLNILEELGRGVFGIVSLALYCGAKVAVKQLKVDTSVDNERRTEEFVREAKFLTAMRSHPNLVHMIGYCLDPLMIVMEYLEGGSLFHALCKNRFNDEEKIRI